MSSLKTLCNEMELLTQYPQIGLAISDSPTPIPGYLFDEISAITFINYGSICKPIIKFLVSRLQQNAPLISVKILKLLLYIAKNGHTEVVEEIKYHEIALKEAMGFHGPPDNLHGNEFYENIRKLSKEILEFVFSENREAFDVAPPPILPAVTGYGSNASTTGLSGFGFTMKSEKTVSEKISDGVTSIVEKLLPSNEKTSQENPLSRFKEDLPQYKPLIINKDSPEHDNFKSVTESYKSQTSISVKQTKQKVRAYKPGKPGGGWDDSDDNDDEDEPIDPSKEDVSKCSSVSFDCIELNKVEVKDNVTDWIDEHKIVDAFLVNEPLNTIDYMSVANECKKCTSLNCDKILTFLLEKLDEKEELIKLRALIFVEYLIFHDIVSLESLIKIVVPPLNNIYEKGAEDIPDSIKIKAKKICLIVQNLSKSSQVLTTQFAQASIKCNS